MHLMQDNTQLSVIRSGFYDTTMGCGFAVGDI